MKTQKRFYKLTAWLLALAMLMTFISSFSLTVSAATTTGTTGDCTWTFDDSTSTLTFSGEGAMEDYATADAAPWYTNKDSITEVKIEEGVTSIAAYAFYQYPSLSTVNIANSVTSFGKGAFQNCPVLQNVRYWGKTEPSSVDGDYAFAECSRLWLVHVPTDYQGDDAFLGKFLQKDLVPTVTSYTVTVVNGTGGGEFTEGEDVLIMADDIEGKQFVCWTSEDGVEFYKYNYPNTRFTMPAKNVTVTATYEEIPTYTVTVNDSIENGTVIADVSEAKDGDTVTLTVTPAEGYKIDTVSYNDVTTDTTITATDGVYSFEMPAVNVTITAAFAKICDHSGSQHTQATDNGDGTHGFECTICGDTGNKSHNFGSGSTCSCGIEITVTGMSLVADTEYRYDAETNTYTVVVAPDDMFVNATVKFNGENLGYITEDNVMQLYEKDDNIFPNSYINSVFDLKNSNFSETWGINLRHYGDDVWFAYRFSNDGGTTWSKTLRYELAQAYSVTANDSENGNVCIDGNKTYAIEGETVTLNVTPAENHTIDTVSYNDGARDVEVTANEGIYSFAMPAGNVTVSAKFKEVPQPEIKSITFNAGSSVYDAATNTFYIDAEHPLILTVTGENMLGQNMRFLVANANVDAVYEDVAPTDNFSFTYTVNEEFYRLIMESFKASGYDANIVYVGMCFADKSPSMDDLVKLNVTKKFITIDETAQTYTYDGVGKTFAIIGDETNGFVMRYEQNGSEVTALNAGVYDVVITRSEDGTYKEFTKTLEDALVIEKADPSYTLPTAKENLAYNGNAIELLNPGYTNDGTMKYTIGGAMATSDVPTRTNAGEYRIICIIEGDKNHNNAVIATNASPIVVNIAKAIPVADAEKVTTARVRRGKTLANATVTYGEFYGINGVALEGTFTWIDNTKKITTDSVEKMKFTPADTNYAEIEIDVVVDSYTPSSGGSSLIVLPATTKNEDGSTTKTTTNNSTGTTTETTTYPDGSTIKKEYQKDGTETITKKDKEGNITTTVKNPDGSTKTEETKIDGTKVITETNANGETKAEVETNDETEVVIPVSDSKEVYNVVVTDKYGNETVIADFKTITGGVVITVDRSVSVSVSTGEKKEFVDVHPVNHWATTSIDYVYIKGLMNGTSETHFSPDATLTRAMIITVLYRLEGEPVANKAIPFADVDMGTWHANAVSWAKQVDIVNGVTENEFAPNAAITREQIAAVIFRYAKFKGMSAATLEENLHFSDSEEISDYAVSAMNWAVGTGLMKGKSSATINPLDNATRAEVATVLHRFIEIYK